MISIQMNSAHIVQVNIRRLFQLKMDADTKERIQTDWKKISGRSDQGKRIQ